MIIDGIRRLWVVLSLVWMVPAALFACVAIWNAYDAGAYHGEPWPVFITLCLAAVFVLAPPVLLLACLVAVLWVVAGFRSKEPLS